ncbi:hypothetical protein, partial [Xanthomonas perforans]|uniref:hypothetical protein n=1 Tax=Xanthomonas perforans TaxID=442694 RepID=UPI001F351C28
MSEFAISETSRRGARDENCQSHAVTRVFEDSKNVWSAQGGVYLHAVTAMPGQALPDGPHARAS